MAFVNFDPMQHDTSGLDLMALQDLARIFTREEGFSVEVGSWAGLTARAILNGSPDSHRLYCVDHWLGNENDRIGEVAKQIGHDAAVRTFCRNMNEHLFTRLFPLVGSSKTWASVFDWKYIKPDLVFIDASHDYDDVLNDINVWSKIVRPGGAICGHDYTTFPGVKKAVDERFKGKASLLGSSIWMMRRDENSPL